MERQQCRELSSQSRTIYYMEVSQMSSSEMDGKVRSYFQLLSQIEQLQGEAEAIKDCLKEQMISDGSEELCGNGWKATWHNISNSRFDAKRFKADHAALYDLYTAKTTGTRFTLNRIRA